MNRVFIQYFDKLVSVFIDDTLSYSGSVDGHVYHLKIILQILMDHSLFVKFRKFGFWLRYIAFLGRVISSEGI